MLHFLIYFIFYTSSNFFAGMIGMRGIGKFNMHSGMKYRCLKQQEYCSANYIIDESNYYGILDDILELNYLGLPVYPSNGGTNQK